ncbi:MAG: hypothetical protein RIN56_14085 [Sporomusaceae bacterium]|nr:hypothetical protein [Sporomusaceae bacterium]
MDEKNPTTPDQNDPLAVTTTDRKTQNSTPTVYPYVDFINRTEP